MEQTQTPIAELIALGGAGLVVSEVGGETADTSSGIVRVGVHRQGCLPGGPQEEFDILLSADAGAPRPWVGVGPELDLIVAELAARVAAQPAAAAVAAQ